MALLFCDSFDHYTSTTQMSQKYPSPGTRGNGSITSGGRRGTNCAQTNGAATIKAMLGPSTAGGVVGFAYRLSAAPQAFGEVLQIQDANGVVHLEVNMTVDGTVRVYRGAGSTLLGNTAAGVFDWTAGFHFLELKFTIDDSVGAVTLRVNGVTHIDLSNIDTRNGGILGWDRVGIGRNLNGLAFWDDLYILDTSSPGPNDLLGDTRIDAHFPNANGSNNDSTPSVGTDRYATIDEASPNNDTDYNTLVNVSDYDTVHIEDHKNVGFDPHAIQITLSARKTDSGDGSVGVVTRQDSTDRDHNQQACDTSYDMRAITVLNQAPDATSWTEAKFNALEIGYKRTA